MTFLLVIVPSDKVWASKLRMDWLKEKTGLFGPIKEIHSLMANDREAGFSLVQQCCDRGKEAVIELGIQGLCTVTMNFKMDSDRAKLFVGGISRDTTEDVLKLHFAKYGVVSDSTISVDRTTRSPRGFGFVTFSDLSAADKALQDTHVILGRTVSYFFPLFFRASHVYEFQANYVFLVCVNNLYV